MDDCIYGVDLTKPFTPVDVREAMFRCFVAAHDAVLEETMFADGKSIDTKEVEELKSLDVKILLQQMFRSTGGDYEQPTKDSLLAAAEGLRAFGEKFRNQDLVNAHYAEIRQLIERLPD